MTTIAHARARRPLLGLRRQPGRVALAAMRLPRPLYHRGWGWMLDHTFLLIVHQGRKTGKRRETVAMVLAQDPDTREVVVCSAWGPNTEWIRNLRAHPALQIQIGRELYVPEQRFLSEDERVVVAAEFRRRHPWRVRLFAAILGWGDLSSETAVREFVRTRPFVAFRPNARGRDPRTLPGRIWRAGNRASVTPTHTDDASSKRFRSLGWRAGNAMVSLLARAGIGPIYLLTTRGRRSGRRRTTQPAPPGESGCGADAKRATTLSARWEPRKLRPC